MPDAEVLLEHREFLRRLARGILHDADAAEDVAQEALVDAMRGRPRNPRGFLATLARRLALTRRRAEERRASRERAAARPEALPSAAEGVLRLELQRRVVDAVLALDEPYQSVVVHRFLYDVTPTEIAKRLGVPLETVRTRLRRALEILRARLDASHGREAWSVALLALAAPRKLPLGGLFAMSLKTKLLAASLLVLAVFGVSTLARREVAPPRAAAPQHEAEAVEPEAAVPPAPLPVDLAAIDRDRDVHGVVVDPSGNPIADADVRVLRYPVTGLGALTALESEEGPGTRTASDGSFALRVERGEEVDLRVKASGFVELQRRWCPAGGKVRIVMREGASLRVRAFDPDGKPLSGAHFVAFKGNDPEIEAEGILIFLEGTTDAQGVFVLEDLLPSREIQLVACHEEFDFPQPVTAKVPDAGEGEAKLVAVKGRDLSGRVTDAATGAPVAGAAVSGARVEIPFVKSVRTDADGRYRLRGWGNEPMLCVHAAGYAGAHETVADRAEIDFALRKGVTLKGVVRDTRGGPVGRAFVYVSTLTEAREAWSDAQGRFEASDLGAPPYALLALKPGFARTTLSLQALEAEIVLADARRLEGRVLGFDGEPLEGVLVNAMRVSPPSEDRHTDDLGRFRFTDLAPGNYVVTATAPGRGRLERKLAIEGADVLDLEFRFERGQGFTVRVVDEAGRPVPDVVVTFQTGRPGAMAERRTDADGRAGYELPKGARLAQVGVKGLDPRFVRPQDTRYRRGDPEPQLALREATTLSGRVLLEGNPLPMAVVRFADAQGFSDISVTDKDGKFSKRVPARAEVTAGLTGEFAKAGKQGWETEHLPIYGEETVRAGTTEVTIEARRVPLDRTLVVRVVTPDGKGVEGMEVFISAHGYHKQFKTDASGRVEACGLPGAENNVFLGGGPGGRAPERLAMPNPQFVKVEPNGQEVVFALRATKEIRGVVLMPDGKAPPAPAPVSAWRGEQVVGYASAAENGTFVLLVPADEPEPLRVAAGTTQGGFYGFVDGVLPGAQGVAIRLAE